MEPPVGFKPNLEFKECRRCYEIEDCLNEFKICNLCCNQMEQITPVGLKPNFKFIECKGCYQTRNYLNESLVCNLCLSGNKIIDDFISYALINCNKKDHVRIDFISYDRFKKIEFIAEGGFSKIYKATWIDGPFQWNESAKKHMHSRGEISVALKELNKSKNINPKELNELKIYYNLVSKKRNNYINEYYGITQNPNTQNFMIIMKYYDLGDLTRYIVNDFLNLNWHKKLNTLRNMVVGLRNIHGADIIHKDYHSGNIFIKGYQAIIGDLGISKSAIDDDDEEIYGVIPYVAPEIFRGHKYTKASDIYSFGMIMWELLTGRRPFWDQIHDAELILQISCDDFRPIVSNISNAPDGYIDLMQECWHSDPNKRPSASELYERIANIHSNKNQPQIIKSAEIGPITANNPDAIYKSRPLSALIKSAESSRNLRSQRIITELGKRKFDDNPIENNEKNIKKIKQNDRSGIDANRDVNCEYITKEFEFDF